MTQHRFRIVDRDGRERFVIVNLNSRKIGGIDAELFPTVAAQRIRDRAMKRNRPKKK